MAKHRITQTTQHNSRGNLIKLRIHLSVQQDHRVGPSVTADPCLYNLRVIIHRVTIAQTGEDTDEACRLTSLNQ